MPGGWLMQAQQLAKVAWVGILLYNSRAGDLEKSLSCTKPWFPHANHSSHHLSVCWVAGGILGTCVDLKLRDRDDYHPNICIPILQIRILRLRKVT